MTTDWTAFRDQVFAEAKVKRERLMTETSVYDIIPGFGSYLGDMEECLSYDEKYSASKDASEDWAKYQENPVPYIVDLLLDFGYVSGFWDDVPLIDCRPVAEEAARRWWGG